METSLEFAAGERRCQGRYGSSLRALILPTYNEILAEYEIRGRRGHRELILEFLGRYVP